MPDDSLIYSQEQPNALLLALSDGTPVCDGVDLAIHEEDEMWRLFYYRGSHRGSQDLDQSLVMYFHSGWKIWSTYRQILDWRFGDPGQIGKILDFASGYGRVTRFIVHDIPPERVWIADIYARGVEFQRQRFGVHGLVSTADPADFHCDERFDAILVSSLFSHLPAGTFLAWLRRLWSLLAPGGVLVFSVHDEALLPAGHPGKGELAARGLHFEEQSESGSLSKAQYGTAWVTERYVRDALDRMASGTGVSVARFPRGFASLQDLYVAVDRPGMDFSGLDVTGGVDGVLDHCGFVVPRQIQIGGWGVDRVSGEPLREIRVRIDGKAVASSSDFHPRPEAAALFPMETVQPVGWQLSFDLPEGADHTSALLTLTAIDAAGREHRFFEGPLHVALLRSARMGLLYSDLDKQRMRTEHEAELARFRGDAEARIDALETRIAAMRASRFWKMRNRWFALKRRLGLTDEP
ncbi:MAG TPA: class I SAM-dependent methyltransferase [Thermoanaerobaculia bacterium]|jgi:SAM-dependent methyltransferase